MTNTESPQPDHDSTTPEATPPPNPAATPAPAPEPVPEEPEGARTEEPLGEDAGAAQIESIAPAPEGGGEGQPLEFSDEVEDGGDEGGEIFDTALAHALSSPAGLRAAIEALLFVTPEALTPHRIARTLEMNDPRLVVTLLEQLRHEYDDQKRGIQLIETAEGYQMATREVFGDLILRLKNRKRRPSLSQAALETLAIVAYRQPIIRAEVEAVRGVESSGTIRNLIDMGLVEMVGRKEVLGRPPMYGTTEQFLQSFGLRNLGDLPSIGELKRRFAENEAKQALAPPTPPAASEKIAEEPPPGDLPGQMFIEIPEDEPAVEAPPPPASPAPFEETGDDFGDGDETARHATRLAAAADPGDEDEKEDFNNPRNEEQTMDKNDKINNPNDEGEAMDELEDDEELEAEGEEGDDEDDEDEDDWDEEEDEDLEDDEEGDEEDEDENDEEEDEDDEDWEDEDEDELSDEDEEDEEDGEDDEGDEPKRGGKGEKK